MQIHTEPHQGYIYTGKVMYYLIENFYSDLGGLLEWPWMRFWDWVRSIPYLDDTVLTLDAFHEVLPRPAYFLNGILTALDCKKKAILIGSYATANGMPFSLIASCENNENEIHHVFPIVFEDGFWRNADATMPWNEYGEAKPNLKFAEELLP